MKKLIILQGTPCSGKSTYAKQYKEEHPDTVIVCRDDIRIELGEGEYSMEYEDEVDKIEKKRIAEGLSLDKEVIVDATNLNPKTLQKLKDIAKGCESEVEIKQFYIPFKEACERDDNPDRNHRCGEKVIKRFYRKYFYDRLEEESKQTVEHKRINIDKSLPPAVICDIDGTIAWMQGRSPYDRTRVSTDKCDKRLAQLLGKLMDSGVTVLFVSGREGTEQCKKDTLQWLRDNLVDYKCYKLFSTYEKFDLYMRKKGDYRPDEVIKKEIYDNSIKGKYDVICVYDDRNKVVSMWREIGMLTCQVNEGDF